MAVAVRAPDGKLTDPETVVADIRERIRHAQEDRKRFEGTWHLNLAAAAGDTARVWDRFSRVLARPPDYDEAESYHADRITEFRAAQLGEMQSDDDRPELLVAQEGSDAASLIAEQLNQAVGHGWEYEWGAAEALLEMRRKALDLGTCAVRARFDPTAGPLRKAGDGTPLEMPVGPDGPFRSIRDATGYVAGLAEQGQTAKFRPIHEGRTRFEVGSAFNLLVPAGIYYERDFPHFTWVRPRPLDQVQGEYGAVAADLTEDTDIGSLDGIGTRESAGQAGGLNPVAGRVRGHIWVFTHYELPCPKYPKGRVVILAGSDMRLLDIRDELPYTGPDGSYRTGVAFFHWWRRSDAFWSRAFVEALRDPQRMIDRRRQQEMKIIDHGMPKVFLKEKGRPKVKPAGIPLEAVILPNDADPPEFFQGIGPGPWMEASIASYTEDMAHAATIGPVLLGENPDNAQTYGQLALLNERERGKRQHMFAEHDLAISYLVECGVHDIRRYWPDSKQVLVSGEQNELQARMFSKSVIPDFYVVRPARGAVKPRSQGAELKRIEDVFAAAVQARVADQRWVKWFADSQAAGKALPVPGDPASEQLDKAQLENDLMQQGQLPPVAYYDNVEIHVPEHRRAQDRALMAGDMDTFLLFERHNKMHEQQAMENQMRLAQTAPPALPPDTTGGEPPPSPSPSAQPQLA